MANQLLFFRVFIVLLVFAICAVPAVSAMRLVKVRPDEKPREHELELVRRLVRRSYSKLAKPLQLDNSTFTVKTRLYLIRIQHVDEATEVFYTTIRLQLNWRDPRLSWFPHSFGGIREIVVPGGYLWVPPLHIANIVDESADITRSYFNFPFRVVSDGKVWFHPTGKSATRCRFDLTYYPFDLQRCLIIIESEIYQEHELIIAPRADDKPGSVSFGMLAENEVWELLPEHTYGIPKVYQSGKHTKFSRFHYVLVMKRKATFFIVTVVIPTVILAIITLLTYLVPVHYVDRPVQSVTTVLAVAIFQSTVAEKLPTNSASCLLTNYLTIIMCSSAITVLTTTVCLAVVDPGEFIKAPWGLPNIALAVVRGIRKLFRLCKRCYYRRRKKSVQKVADGSDDNDVNDDNEDGSSESVKFYVAGQGQRRACLGHYQSSVTSLGSTGSPRRRSRHGFAYPPTKLVHTRRITERRQAITGTKKDKEKTYEAGRRFLGHWQAWFVAYTVNWTGFFICLTATVSLPVYAYITKAKADFEFIHNYEIDEGKFEPHYYGES